MHRTIIFAGSYIEDLEWTKAQVQGDDFVICADSGLHHAHAMDIMPNVIVGDFDSVDTQLLQSYKAHPNVEVRHTPDEYRTDLMKALDIAPVGSEVHVYGAIGGRGDHDFSHYLLLRALENPDRIILKTHKEQRWIIKTPLQFRAKVGDKVGVFPLDHIESLSFSGLRYAADGLPGPYTFGWNGSCNIVCAEQVEINMNSGTALVIHTAQ